MDHDLRGSTESAIWVENNAFLGCSPAFRNAVRSIERIAAYDATVLVQGETGTGKELAARAVHYLSSRRDHPFVPVNCGAIPEGLFASEFFGYVKGAFTDAKDTKPGLVTLAKGGTLFLDEIECLSPKGQVVFLRFLQDQFYRPVGGRLMSADVRIVAASNRDLIELVRLGEFRQDLFYRLALLTLTLPPLRERIGDPALLAQHFILVGSKRFRAPMKTLHPCTLKWLDSYQWPGNVRELENLMYREILMTDSSEIRIDADQPHEAISDRRKHTDRRQLQWRNLLYQQARSVVLNNFEHQYLSSLLAQTRGNVSAAAKLAGKERRSFGRLLKKNGIDKSHFDL